MERLGMEADEEEEEEERDERHKLARRSLAAI